MLVEGQLWPGVPLIARQKVPENHREKGKEMQKVLLFTELQIDASLVERNLSMVPIAWGRRFGRTGGTRRRVK